MTANNYYYGDIVLFPSTRVMVDFAPCNGQLLPINDNAALFSLIGTQYGGNGTTNFALPDFRGITPTGLPLTGTTFQQEVGVVTGQEQVTLVAANLPQHTHSRPSQFALTVNATTEDADLQDPGEGSFMATTVHPQGTQVSTYAPSGTQLDTALNTVTGATGSVSVSSTGGSVPFSIMQPYLGMSFFICIDGLYPQLP